jgi:hypothetical protein
VDGTNLANFIIETVLNSHSFTDALILHLDDLAT